MPYGLSTFMITERMQRQGTASELCLHLIVRNFFVIVRNFHLLSITDVNNRGLNKLEVYFFSLHGRSKDEQSGDCLRAPAPSEPRLSLLLPASILCIGSHSQATSRPRLAVEAPAVTVVFQ